MKDINTPNENEYESDFYEEHDIVPPKSTDDIPENFRDSEIPYAGIMYVSNETYDFLLNMLDDEDSIDENEDK